MANSENSCDVAVVGGGIVGLSTAYALTRAAPRLRVVVLEKERGLARHQTGRNSGVIHSGVYYRPGSLKARFAVAGAREMTAFCAEQGLPYAVPGKLVVAVRRGELPRLHALAQRGRENGVPVRELGRGQVAEREPHVAALAGLEVRSTGVADYAAVARRLARLARRAGVEVRTGAEVLGFAPFRPPGGGGAGRGLVVRTAAGEVRAAAVVNCAGLHGDAVARLAGGEPGVRVLPFRGEYYELAPGRRGLVRGLVYPVPDPAFPFLGVHLTRGVDGGVHVGPNAVPAGAREGYGRSVVRGRDVAGTLAWPGFWRLARRHWRRELGELHRSASKRAFTAAVRRLLPEVEERDLLPAEPGVRAQAVDRSGALVDDFLFGYGAGGRLVSVLNAPSPAATAALPIGREVARRVLERVAPEAAGAVGAGVP